MGVITLKWEDNNSGLLNEEGHRIYRSVGTPLDFDNMPTHIGEVGADVTEYVDEHDFEDDVVYYSVSSYRTVEGQLVERFSDMINFDTGVAFVEGV